MNDFEKNVFRISHININKSNYDTSYYYTLYDFASNDKHYRIGQYSEIKNFTKASVRPHKIDYIECITDYYDFKNFIRVITEANYGSVFGIDYSIFRREIYEYLKNEKIPFHYGTKDEPMYFYIDDRPCHIDEEDTRYIKIGGTNVCYSDRINRLD